jgi:hypothetical protein
MLKTDLGALHAEGVPYPFPEDVSSSLSKFQNTRLGVFQDWNHASGGMLILTRFAENNQIHSVAGPGMARKQLTFNKDRATQATVRPPAPVCTPASLSCGVSVSELTGVSSRAARKQQVASLSAADEAHRRRSHGFAFLMDNGGDEAFQVYYQDFSSGDHWRLSSGAAGSRCGGK